MVGALDLGPSGWHADRGVVSQRLCGSFPSAETFTWVQEEPLNAGAWSYVYPQLERIMRLVGKGSSRLQYVGRPALPTPAVGLSEGNKEQGRRLMKELWERI